MHSSEIKIWQIDEFITETLKQNGIHFLFIDEHYYSKILINQLNQKKIKFKNKSYAEMNWNAFIQDKNNLSLFSFNEVIHMEIFYCLSSGGNKFSIENLEVFINENASVFSQACFLFIFDISPPKKISSICSSITHIGSVKFYEEKNLWNFLSQNLSLKLNENFYEKRIEKQKLTEEEIFLLSEQIVYYQEVLEEKEFQVVIENLIISQNFDLFKMSDFLNQKKFHSLLLELKSITQFDDLLRVCLFLQSHLLKLKYLENHSGPDGANKYAKEILRYSKNWSSQDFDFWMDFFCRLENAAKTKQGAIFFEMDFLLSSSF